MNGSTKSVLVGGVVAATLDLLYACVRQGLRGRDPEWVLQSVASGWLGQGAFESGATGAALGFVSHYGIVFVAATLYLLASRRWPVLISQAAACGIAFGVAIFLFMNFVVIPASAAPFKLKYPLATLLEGFASHAVFVGLPIAVAIRRFATTRGSAG
jgi:uncharacterized membrane protein YagU involved in acid resistance